MILRNLKRKLLFVADLHTDDTLVHPHENFAVRFKIQVELELTIREIPNHLVVRRNLDVDGNDVTLLGRALRSNRIGLAATQLHQ